MSEKKIKFCNTILLPYDHINISGLSAISARGKQWRVGEVIDIYFLDGTEEQKDFVKKHCIEWTKYANLKFNFTVNRAQSDIRITFRSRFSQSYIGTDALFIPKDEPTMYFGWLDRGTVIHEFGHAIGLLHEHQNPEGGIIWDEEAVIKDLSGPPNSWSIEKIRRNVLNKLNPKTLHGTVFDEHSIMIYPIPQHWIKNGKEIQTNSEISKLDRQHVAELYPYRQGLGRRVKTGWFKRFLARVKLFFS